MPSCAAIRFGCYCSVMTQIDNIQLTGKLLVAMPGMGDPRFERAVVYICAHTRDGTMGLIVNKPTPESLAFDLFAQLKIPDVDRSIELGTYFGGPVENERGFVLHSSDYCASRSTLKVDERISMTATLDILEEIARGDGPQSAILLLGYSGWGPNQLESEIGQNGWLTCEANTEIVFATKPKLKWTAALNSIGVDPLTLSAAAGRA